MHPEHQPRLRLGLYLLSSIAPLLALALPAAGGPEELAVTGLDQPVEILRDRWGIAHIYARNEHDLFFAQGYNVARDRLFQLELWRRQATGTLAEIQGSRALPRDIGARLLKFRGDMTRERKRYHPHGVDIIAAFVQGINAYIERIKHEPEKLLICEFQVLGIEPGLAWTPEVVVSRHNGLFRNAATGVQPAPAPFICWVKTRLGNSNLHPIEFQVLGIEPGLWTPEVVVSRHNGLFRNVTQEVQLARLVHLLGEDQARELLNLHPGRPRLHADEVLDLGLIREDLLGPYTASRAPVRFVPEDVLPAFRGKGGATERESETPAAAGSNNWVISGEHTFLLALPGPGQ